MKKIIICLIAGLAITACNSQNKTDSKTPEQIKAQLIKQIPGVTTIDSVNKTPISDLYEVVIGRKIIYASTNGKYLVIGNIIDPAAKQNLTEKRISELSKIDFSKLPLDLAIKEVNGNGSRKIAVFSDPDCPYCAMFEKQVVSQLQDVTIYTFLFPLPIHPNALSDSKKIWCSKDRAATWIDWMRNKKALPTNINCDTSGLDKIIDIAANYIQVDGTPTIVLSDGQILQGMLPPEQLNQRIDGATGRVLSEASAPITSSAK